MIRPAFLVLAALAVQAYAATPKPVATAAPPNWRSVATLDDRTRLHGWRDAFVKGLDQAKASGHAADIAREGVLLAPDAALPDPAIPVGAYRCRTVKLGNQNGGEPNYAAYGTFDCRVADFGGLRTLTKLTGSQRPFGRLFAPEDRRQVFLGTIALGDETRSIIYGRDRDRNMIGALERIGPRRWRLVLPYPRFESTLDVIELVPDA